MFWSTETEVRMRIALLLVLWLVSISSAPACGETTELGGKLDARVSHYSLAAKGLADAVLRVAKQFNLPIGVEWRKDGKALRNVTLSWNDATVRDIMRSVVKKYPPYSFQVKDGVIHVFLPDLVSDRHNFLNLKVPHYFEIRETAGGFANERLRKTVQNVVSPRDLPPGAGEAGSYTSGNVSEVPLTLHLGGLTVREALDRLVDASEHKMWVVSFSAVSGLTPTGFRRTETIWHPTPFPDRDQPMWDFLAWQEYMPATAPHGPSPVQ